MASPSRLHSLWRQMQRCILFLPSEVSSPSVPRHCQLPGTPQKSEVGGRGGKEAKRKEIMKMEEKRNCTTLRRPLRRIAFPYWYSQLIFMCCIFRNIAFLTRPLICPVYTLAWCICGTNVCRHQKISVAGSSIIANVGCFHQD